MRPHDLLVKRFWLRVNSTRIWDSAMSRSYAHFWSFCSWGHSSRHELDLANISDVASGQFLRSRSHRQYRDCAPIMGCAVSRSHVFGLLRARVHSAQVPMTWESRVTSSITWAILELRKQKNPSGTQGLWCSVGLDRESRINLLPMQRLSYTPL